MAATLRDLLQPQVLLDVVSRTRPNQGRLARWLGYHYTRFDERGGMLTGPNVRESPTRSGAYTIYDRTRTVAKGRAPGTGPAWTQPQPIGRVFYTCARFHEKIVLQYEELGNLADVVGPNTVIDSGGQDYIFRQMTHLAARFNNAVELMAAGVIRGKFYMANVGEDWIPRLAASGTPGEVTIDLKIPAGNQGQLNMLGAGNIIGTTWSNTSAPIISNDLPKIQAAAAQQHGFPLTDVFVSPTVWGYVIKNTEVINTGGSANTPFEQFEFTRDRGVDGRELTEWVAVLRGYPTLRWHILTDVIVADGGTDPSYSSGTGTLTTVLPDNTATFMPPVDGEWTDIIHCPEWIAEAPGRPAVKKRGYSFWSETTTQPSAIDLIGLLNAIPRLRVPTSIVPATVVF